jgi:hypothetical protein
MAGPKSPYELIRYSNTDLSDSESQKLTHSSWARADYTVGQQPSLAPYLPPLELKHAEESIRSWSQP